MKRWISLGVALVMCFAMAGCCLSTAIPTAAPEEVAMRTLLDDLSNQAKAQQNIGKATVMFVVVKTIYADHCVANYFLQSGSAEVYMDTEILAQLEQGQYAAIYGVVDRVEANDNGTSFRYVFKDGSLADMELFDAYVADIYCAPSWGDRDYIFDAQDTLQKYASARWQTLTLDESQIREYLLGTWERRITQYFSRHDFSGTYTPEITFCSDGTYVIETMSDRTSPSDFRVNKCQEEYGTWEITDGGLKLDGYLSSYNGWGFSVYRISENVFLWNGEMFIRCE